MPVQPLPGSVFLPESNGPAQRHLQFFSLDIQMDSQCYGNHTGFSTNGDLCPVPLEFLGCSLGKFRLKDVRPAPFPGKAHPLRFQ